MAVGGIPIAQQIDPTLMLTTLKKNKGRLLSAARELDIDVVTLRKHFNSTEELKEELRSARNNYIEWRLDKCEEVMDKLLENVDDDPNNAFKSSQYILNNLGRERGYAHPEVASVTEAQEKGYQDVLRQLKENHSLARNNAENNSNTESKSEVDEGASKAALGSDS